MKKILILASNPRQDLNIDYEIHVLKGVIDRSQEGEQFEVNISSAVRPKDLQALFLKYEPRIVHFCGHGTGERGLVLEDDDGQEKLVSTSAISNLFKEFSDKVECVLLNACYTEMQANVIVEHINYVIGMNQAIRDDAAIIFARSFYQALAYGKAFEEAYKLGCNGIELQISNAMISRSSVSEPDRKLSPLDGITPVILPEHSKPILKIKSSLTPFLKKEVLIDSEPFLDLTKVIQEEISRKRYREDIQEDFKLGQTIPTRVLTQQDYRWRQVLLNKVKDYWIRGVLENSLHTKALIELDIKERPDAVQNFFNGVEELSIQSDKFFEWLQASDIFEQMGAGRTLLILGEPGTGKTISLLKLAERLIKRSEQNLSLLPVVFNLSSWAVKRQSIADWLVEELKDKYQVSKALCKIWIEQEQLILLLDGLDEVKAEYRNDCVRALNKFIEAHGITEMVVCSRIKDYEALSERLNLRSAICIQKLTSEFINWYLEDAGKSLEGLKTLLRQDKELADFAKTPLILSIMSLTYYNYSSQEVLQQLGSIEDRHKKLFDNYIERMLSRRNYNNSTFYPKETFLQLMCYLSCINSHASQSIILVENLQPNWFSPKNIKYSNYSLRNSLNFSELLEEKKQLSSKLIDLFPLVFNRYKLLVKIFTIGTRFTIPMYLSLVSIFYTREMVSGLIAGLVITGFTSLFIDAKDEIVPISAMKWSKEKLFNSLIKNLKRIFILIILAIFVAVGGLNIGGALLLEAGGSIASLLILYFYPIIIIFIGLSESLDKPKMDKTNFPNQKIWLSAKFTIFFSIIFSVVCEVIFILINAVFSLMFGTPILSDLHKLIQNPSIVIFNIGFFMLIGGLFVPSLFACIQHFSLRLSLFMYHISPWNYARFLDYATQRLFMQKVGGGYIFVHRMLMEHFAQMKQN